MDLKKQKEEKKRRNVLKYGRSGLICHVFSRYLTQHNNKGFY
ncbi:hypothetical protein [Scatolibacter rhodanostii]|nr:hypothetical protein [Scatolibacter rhodanostii]